MIDDRWVGFRGIDSHHSSLSKNATPPALTFDKNFSYHFAITPIGTTVSAVTIPTPPPGAKPDTKLKRFFAILSANNVASGPGFEMAPPVFKWAFAAELDAGIDDI